MPDEKQTEPIGRMIQMGSAVYNPDHIVKVDLRRPEFAAVHTTLGIDEFEGQTALDIHRFFGVAAPAAEDTKKAKRRAA